MKANKVLLCHNEVLAAFCESYYNNLITKNHLGDETVIKVGEEQEFVYPVKYKGRVYAVPSTIVEQDKMPIKITKSKKIAYRSNVYHYVTKFASAKIKE
jgi:hypothetical protein